MKKRKKTSELKTPLHEAESSKKAKLKALLGNELCIANEGEQSELPKERSSEE